MDGIWCLLSLVVLAHPLVYCGYLEAKEPPHPMSRETPFNDPPINGVLGHPKVGGHIVDANPAFFSGHFNLHPLVRCQNHCLGMLPESLPMYANQTEHNYTEPVHSRQ